MPLPQEALGIGVRKKVVPLSPAVSPIVQPTNQPSITGSTSGVSPTNQPTVPPANQPSATPSLFQRLNSATQPVQQIAKSGLQKVFDALSLPSQWTEKLLTGGKGYDATYADPNSILRKVIDYSPMNLATTLVNKKAGRDPWANETGRKIASTASRFIADPLNLIPFGKVGELLGKGAKTVSEATGLSKVGTKISEFARTTPRIYKVIEKVNPYFRIPEFGKVVQAAENTTGTRISKLFGELKGMVVDLKPEDQVHIGEVIEGITKPTNSKFAKIATRVTEISKQIGQEAVNTGLMPKKVFEDMTAKGYLSHIFLNEGGKEIMGGVRNISKVVGNQFKKRTGAEGYIKEFAPAVYKGLGSEIKDIEAAKMFKQIATQFGKKIGRGAEALPGYIRASEVGVKGRGFAKAFAKIQIPEAIGEYLTNIRKVSTPGVYEKGMNIWKAGKTIWNPAYHVRNAISNQILSSMGTGKNLLSTTSDYIKAVKEYKTGTSSLFKVAQDVGIIGRRSFGTGLNELMDTAGLVEKGGVKGWLSKIADKPKELQNVTEETAKLNVFKTWMQKLADKSGTTLENALKNNDLVTQAADKAQEAIFSPYRISQAERSTAGKFIPFYSFTRQALPFSAKTLVNNPKSIAVFGKIKSAIEGLSQEPNIQLPDYLKNQIRLGSTDKNGNPVYFDPSYIYPFGNFIESGLGKGQLPFGLSFPPLATEIASQLFNEDPYFGGKIGKSNMFWTNVGQRLAHFYRTASPAAITTLTNTIYPALVAKKDSQGRTRNVGQAILSALGIKLSAPDIQNIQVQNLRSQKSKASSIQQEMDQILNDPNLTRSQKDSQIKQLQQLPLQ